MSHLTKGFYATRYHQSIYHHILKPPPPYILRPSAVCNVAPALHLRRTLRLSPCCRMHILNTFNISTGEVCLGLSVSIRRHCLDKQDEPDRRPTTVNCSLVHVPGLSLLRVCFSLSYSLRPSPAVCNACAVSLAPNRSISAGPLAAF